MIAVKSLTIIALVAGGTSLAIAQNGPATGGEPPVAGGAGGNSAATGTNLRPSHHAFKQHKMYMQAAPSTHKHKHTKKSPTPSTTK